MNHQEKQGTESPMRIILSSLRFYAYHGVLQQERTVGAFYTLDITIDMDFTQPMLNDDITRILNYADVYKVVKAEMQVPSRLLEHVAGRIVKAIFTRFNQAAAISLRLMKEKPPITGFDGNGCGVEVNFSREKFLTLLKNSEKC